MPMDTDVAAPTFTHALSATGSSTINFKQCWREFSQAPTVAKRRWTEANCQPLRPSSLWVKKINKGIIGRKFADLQWCQFVILCIFQIKKCIQILSCFFSIWPQPNKKKEKYILTFIFSCHSNTAKILLAGKRREIYKDRIDWSNQTLTLCLVVRKENKKKILFFILFGRLEKEIKKN